MKGLRKNRVYVLEGKSCNDASAFPIKVKLDKTKLWHYRLGHVNDGRLIELPKQGAFGGDRITNLYFCEHCVLWKQTRVFGFQKAVHRTNFSILDYIHSDAQGSKTITHSGARYYITFIDDFSRIVWVYTTKNKNEPLKKFNDWKRLVENETGRKLQRLRTDNGLEYLYHEFTEFCKKMGQLDT